MSDSQHIITLLIKTILEIKTEKNLSYRDIGQLCKYDFSHIKKVLSGKIKNIDTLLTILESIAPELICTGDLYNFLDLSISNYFESLIVDNNEHIHYYQTLIMEHEKDFKSSTLIYRFKLFLLVFNIFNYKEINENDISFLDNHVDKLSNDDLKFYYDSLAAYSILNKQYTNSLLYANQSLSIDGSAIFNASAYYHSAIPLAELTSNAEALRCAKKAYDFFESNHHDSRMILCLQLIGVLYNRIADFKNGIKINEYLISLLKKRHDNDLIPKIYNNLLLSAYKLQDYPKCYSIINDGYRDNINDSGFSSLAVYLYYLNHDLDNLYLWSEVTLNHKYTNQTHLLLVKLILAIIKNSFEDCSFLFKQISSLTDSENCDTYIIAIMLMIEINTKLGLKDNIIKYQNLLIQEKINYHINY